MELGPQHWEPKHCIILFRIQRCACKRAETTHSLETGGTVRKQERERECDRTEQTSEQNAEMEEGINY